MSEDIITEGEAIADALDSIVKELREIKSILNKEMKK